MLALAISANSISDREACLIESQSLVARLHNSSKITRAFNIKVQSYYGRDIKVLFVDNIADLVKSEIKDVALKNSPLIGALSQVGNFVELSDNPLHIPNIRNLYNY